MGGNTSVRPHVVCPDARNTGAKNPGSPNVAQQHFQELPNAGWPEGTNNRHPLVVQLSEHARKIMPVTNVGKLDCLLILTVNAFGSINFANPIQCDLCCYRAQNFEYHRCADDCGEQRIFDLR